MVVTYFAQPGQMNHTPAGISLPCSPAHHSSNIPRPKALLLPANFFIHIVAEMDDRFQLDADNFANVLWDFDVSDFDFDAMAIDSNSSATSESSGSSQFKKIVKVSKTSRPRTVAKIPAGPRRRSRNMPNTSVISALLPAGPKPNVSRRPPSNILYAFPHFDKCDSLLYFPSTFTRHMNTGDMKAVSKLLSAHLDKNCSITMFHGLLRNINSQTLLSSYEIINEFQPDRIMCVHTTKVEENQITASIHMKFTDSKVIFESVARDIPEQDLVRVNCTSRDRNENLKHKLLMTKRDERLQREYLALADTDVDLVIYVHITMKLIFDDFSKKITYIDMSGKMTSLQAAAEYMSK